MSLIPEDIRFGLRLLLKNPKFSAVALLTLGLGIGVNTAIYSLVEPLVLRPLPVQDPRALVVLGLQDKHLDHPDQLSFPDYVDYRDNNTVFTDLAAYTPTTIDLTYDGRPERIWAEEVTANFFDLLGIQPARGRLFTTGEDRAPLANPVVVVTYECWQRRFGAEPSIVGKNITLNRHPAVIVGVAPEGFLGAETFFTPDAFIPVNQISPGLEGAVTDRNERLFNVIGRLKPGVSINECRVSLGVLAQQLEKQYPRTNEGVGIVAYPEIEARPHIAVAGSLPTVAAVFFGLAGLVLIITCANVANLMLGRGLARQREMAIRAALGASRWRLIRQSLAESVLLSICSGILALLLAIWATRVFSKIKLSADAPAKFVSELSWTAFLFTLVVSIAAGIICGLIPAIRSSRLNLQHTLKEAGRGAAGSARNYIRGLLVVTQVAVSMVLLICAGEFIQGAREAANVDLGFRLDKVLLFSVDLHNEGYDEARGRAFYRNVLERLRSQPRTSSASMARFVPFGYESQYKNVYVEGASNTEKDAASVLYNVVDTDYFKTAGTAILEGVEFSDYISEKTPRTAIVNQVMAQKLWPGQDAMGKRFKTEINGPYLEVAGIAANTKFFFLGEQPQPIFYLPFAQNYQPKAIFHLLARDDVGGLAEIAPRLVHELDSDLHVYDVKSMESHFYDGRAILPMRLGQILTSIFGLLGLVLAIVGLYGVVTYYVSQRLREIGIRMALGASRRNILSLVVGHGITLTSIGLAAGMIGAWALTRFISSVLYGVASEHVLVFVFAGAALGLVALLACFFPAQTAANVDPVSILKQD